MSEKLESVDEELARRHRSATSVIYGVLALILVLVALSLAGVLRGAAVTYDPTLDLALRIAIVFFGLGAVALRRAKFSAVRLQAIAALRGASGLLETLQKTTGLVALIGGAIALMGAALTLLRGDMDRTPAMVWIGLIAAAVLLYAYPRRAAWRRVVQTARPDGAEGTPSAKGTLA